MRKKKTDKKIEPKEKKSRAKYERPDKLGKLIEIYNLVPVNTILKTEEKLITEAAQATLQYDDRYGAREYETRQFLKNAAIDFFEKHPKLNEHIKTQGLFGYFNSEIDTYLQFEYFRKNMDELVSLGTMWNRNRDSHTLQSDELITFKISKAGKYEYYSSGTIAKMLAEALKDAYVDRLRRCEICNRIFWAENKNSFTCSESCRNALRQRKHRAKNKESVNEKRRERYQKEKQKKELEKEERRKALLDKYK